MFALQLTETPVATGAKGPRAPEAPLAPAGAVKADFQTYLGQAQTAVAALGAGATVTAPTPQAVPGEAAAVLPIERVPRTQAGAIAPVQPDALAGTDPVQPVALAHAEIAGPEGHAAPDLTLAGDAPTQVLAEGQILAPDMEQMPTPSVPDQEAVPARTLSPDTETGSAVETPGLSPSAIPDAGLPLPASGIPSDQTQIATETPVDTPVPEPVASPADLAEEMIQTAELHAAAADMSERASDPAAPELPLETDPAAPDMGLPVMAGGAQIASDRRSGDIPLQTASPSLNAQAREQVQTEAPPRLQTLDQPVGDAAFSRILTEVSVAAAPVTAPAQTVQSSATPAQAQTLPPLDMTQPNWAEKLVEDVSLQPMGRGETLTLTLTPERLGTMQVRLEMQDGQTHVHFITETPEAARLLTEAQPRLADLMSRAGVDLGSQSASTGQNAQQNDRSAQGAPMQEGASAPQPEPAGDSPEAPARSHSRSTVDVVA